MIKNSNSQKYDWEAMEIGDWFYELRTKENNEPQKRLSWAAQKAKKTRGIYYLHLREFY